MSGSETDILEVNPDFQEMMNPQPVNLSNAKPHSIPAGVDAINCSCSKIYPLQTNPLQVAPQLKYWLGGPDPLDYISIYSCEKDLENKSLPHWHYVSFGLTDLHGDERVHEKFPTRIVSNERVSGCGFELTFRLRKELTNQDKSIPAVNKTTLTTNNQSIFASVPTTTCINASAMIEDVTNYTKLINDLHISTNSPLCTYVDPPLWPIELMQSIARYIFNSGNVICSGDHITWHAPLNGKDDCILQHMLITQDTSLIEVQGPYGSFNFLQIVGITNEELSAAQKWNVPGLVKLLSENIYTGGSMLVCDAHRQKSLFESDENAKERVYEGYISQGSSLSGLAARCSWRKTNESDLSCLTPIATFNSSDIMLVTSSMDVTQNQEKLPLTVIEHLHISICHEAAQLMPLILRGRLLHGNHFTLKSITGNSAITFVPDTMAESSLVNSGTPYISKGLWLQILVTPPLIESLMECIDCYLAQDSPSIILPHFIELSSYKLQIVIQPDQWACV